MKIAHKSYLIILLLFCYFVLDKKTNIIASFIIFASVIAISSSKLELILGRSSLCRKILLSFSIVPICLSMAIALSFAQKTIVAINTIGFSQIFLETSWIPNDPENPKFGIWAPVAGTALVSLMSILITVPLSIISALYTLLYANKKIKFLLKIAFNIPASIPSVVYGYFGASKLAPIIFNSAKFFGLKPSYENALVASVTMSIMVMPIMFSITYDSISTIPKATLYNSYALGYTRAETAQHLILPGIYYHIINAVLIVTSRIIAETMIVLLTAGQSNHININPLQEVSTATSQIIDLLLGDGHSDSSQFLMGYVLSFVLFIFCLLLNTAFLCLHSKNKTNKILRTFNIIYRYKEILNKKRKTKKSKGKKPSTGKRK